MTSITQLTRSSARPLTMASRYPPAMDLGISGKVAMVAAASKGIGLATAKMLAQEGCQIAICGRTEETLEEATSQISPEARSYVVDVASPDDLKWWVEQVVQDLGEPDILVTNTGGPPAGRLVDMTDEQWQAGFDGTLLNIIRLVRLTGPMMQAKNWGRIVHITSYVAKEPSPLLPVSSTLRTGINALTKLQALEYAPFGVTVNAILPGSTLTDRQRHLAEIRGQQEGITPEQALEKQGQDVPMKRLADPDEIAAAIVFLCSGQASYLTGESLLVDGGLSRGAG